MSRTLTPEDIARLLADGSPAARAATAGKVAQLVEAPLSAAERREAEALLALFARDAERLVRAAVAEQARASRQFPVAILEALARDEAEIAEPVLAGSMLLPDAVLIAIVRGGDSDKQVAIAGRERVSSAVSDAIIDHGVERAVARLAANEGADIAERGFERMMQRFSGSLAVAEGIASRRRLPPTVAELLFAHASERVRRRLEERGIVPMPMAAALVQHAREKATVGYAALTGDAAASIALARQLHDSRRLTPSVVLRSLCMGDVPFFEAALALKAGIGVDSARALIHDSGGRGLEKLLARTGMPPQSLRTARAALAVAAETELDGGPDDRPRHVRRMIERVLTQIDDPGADTLDFLLARLDQPEASRAGA